MTPMVVQCSSCLTEFELDPRKVPTNGVRARCSVCSAVIAVPAPPTERSAEPAPRREAEQPSGDRPAEAAAPARTESSASPVQPPAVQPRATQPAAQPEAPTPSIAAMGASGESPAAPPGAAAAAHAPTPAPPAPPAPAPQTATPVGGVSRRPINPFLSKDPALRAKRLARALVSDIVAYHPARHAEGLREGTLKTLFRDEIKKSYEEYVDQVGREFASSTTHFQDALNDVLAGGKKMF